MSESSVPQLLYKYRSAADLDRLKKIVIDGELYFGNSFEFNDIFDLKPAMKFDFSDEEVESRLIAYWKTFGANADIAASLKRLRATYGTNDDPRSKQKSGEVQEALGRILEEWGIFCAAERYDNVLMWSHYADSYRGVCLELSTENLGTFEKVRYMPDRPMFDGLPGPSQAISEIATTAIFTKSDDWAYECEWRAVGQNKGAIKVNPSPIVGIIFGPRCLADTRQKIVDFVVRSGRDISLSEIIPDQVTFTLRREPLN